VLIDAREFDAARIEVAVERVGEGESPEPLQRFRNHKKCHDPAGEESD